MRYYEIVFMIHPDKSEKSNKIISEYKKLISDLSGNITRLEDWGRRQLSYQIKKLSKAHYILINIELPSKNINKIKNNLKLNNSIIRYIIIGVNKKISKISPILKEKLENQDKKENIVIKKINV